MEEPNTISVKQTMIKILIVDDMLMNLVMMESMLKQHGYTNITSIEHPEKALKLIKNTQFDLVLLDIQMPILDGFELLSMIKKSDLNAKIPVIFVSACSDDSTIIKAFNSDVADYLIKPIFPEDLIPRIDNALQENPEFKKEELLQKTLNRSLYKFIYLQE